MKITRKSTSRKKRMRRRTRQKNTSDLRYDAYVIYGIKFKPILARKDVVHLIIKKLKKQGYNVRRAGVNPHNRLLHKKWVYY